MTAEDIEKIQKKVHKTYYAENSKTKKKLKAASIKVHPNPKFFFLKQTNVFTLDILVSIDTKERRIEQTCCFFSTGH